MITAPRPSPRRSRRSARTAATVLLAVCAAACSTPAADDTGTRYDEATAWSHHLDRLAV
ncbi:hypothetical protein ACFV1N_15600 [Streptosporangium canum]|uniref:hypothetical protein n=1 Tax=Streptosporangium canum TaxID=324952 RepID=UPI0036ACC102